MNLTYFLVNPMTDQVVGIEHGTQGYMPQAADKYLDQKWCDAMNEQNGVTRKDALLAFRLSMSPSTNPNWDMLDHLVK